VAHWFEIVCVFCFLENICVGCTLIWNSIFVLLPWKCMCRWYIDLKLYVYLRLWNCMCRWYIDVVCILFACWFEIANVSVGGFDNLYLCLYIDLKLYVYLLLWNCMCICFFEFVCVFASLRLDVCRWSIDLKLYVFASLKLYVCRWHFVWFLVWNCKCKSRWLWKIYGYACILIWDCMCVLLWNCMCVGGTLIWCVYCVLAYLKLQM